MNASNDPERVRREAEAHITEMREKLLRELNWQQQEQLWQQQNRFWQQQARQDYWQRWFWVGVVALAALGIIYR